MLLIYYYTIYNKNNIIEPITKPTITPVFEPEDTPVSPVHASGGVFKLPQAISKTEIGYKFSICL